MQWTDELVQWINLYTKDLYKWALYKTADKMLAEDLVQDTFLAAAESIHKFDRKSQPKTWLLGILKNKIAAHYKKTISQSSDKYISIDFLEAFFDGRAHWHKGSEPYAWEADTENLLDNPLFNQEIEKCLQKLPLQFGACIRLKFLEEKQSKEICQELAISPTNYWQLLHRAKLHLRSCLENNWFKKQEII